jgi:penicillin-binding protein 2
MSQSRITAILGFVLILFLLIEFKIFSLQILNGSYYQREAQKRSTRIELIHSLRGRILDRNGKPLVEDMPSFDLHIIPSAINRNPETVKNLSLLLKTKLDVMNKKIAAITDKIESKAANKNDREKRRIIREGMANSYPFWQNITLDTAVEITANQGLYSGVFVKKKDKRNYIHGGLASHLLGYMGRVSPDEYEAFKNNDYFKNHLHPAIDEFTRQILDENGEFMEQQFGRFGVEKQFEQQIAGLNGVRMVELDFVSRTEKELSRYPPTDGNDIALTIDLPLQKELEQSLQGKTGSAIVMDVTSGEIWAIASAPPFNPNSLQAPVSQETINYIFKSPQKPLYNRTIAGEYAPGSLFKIITGIASLENKSIHSNSTFNCTGYFYPNSKHFKCWTAEYNRSHGPMNIVSGLQHSCNVFFFNAGKLTGPENILEWAEKFGFGNKTGIDLEGERKGLIPSPEQKLKRYHKEWATSDTLNISIGQGDLMVTPIQVVRMMAAVANGGKLVTPHVIKNINTAKESDENEAKKKEEKPEEIASISNKTLSLIRQGLYEVVHSDGGTAHGLGLDKFSAAGKTSTAEVGMPGAERRSHAWFVGFAPFDKPRFAFVVMIEHGGKGSEAAVPTAAVFMERAMEINQKEK